MQIVLHMRVEHEHVEQKARDWRHDVKIDPKLDVYRDNFTGMMTELESMQYVHVVRTSVTKHSVELATDEN